MSRALVREGFHRGSSGRRPSVGEEHECFQPCDDMSGHCATTGVSCERTIRVASAVHVVAAKDNKPWICGVCTAQNNPGNISCFSCCTFRDTQLV
ncbi:MAG: hypothetical protein UU49_C0005G0025 [Candidatus Magasanikbacteria bacterium GW2011_GWC2_41_17]|uniref:RanBP2-type domain-containing protein n=2 Tax=Candidatus Magasanikiibacteriota TaxID=1752731 RepID=A0A0G0WKB4_9BACT|nr:MAG: hypothetical protein UU49_C0005G0025 [Candidatus Magasanikbacteria bacterium GW2011_GWC2_41_17]KKS13239.1 MAG: hypothetical protein UU69_C0010G0014 [Candidatus Magasanikbacteria bacterium GW2011_GWA2_41_55]